MTTTDLSPQRMHDASHRGIVLAPQGRGRAKIAAGGYADDLEAVAPTLEAL